MRILLVSPAGSDLYAKLGTQLPPLGLLYIAAFARNGGHQVEVIDFSIEKHALSNVHLARFDLVGVSADTPRYPEAVEVAKHVKEVGIPVVMGGYHVTFLDEEALNTGFVDFVVRGEGEEIFLNLVNALENKSDLSEVDGISYLDGGKFVRNKNARLPENLDNFPLPARNLLPVEKYKGKIVGVPLANLITSRGCPYDCSFCSSTKFSGMKWRARSAQSIVDEIEMLYHKHGFRAFAFMDDNFTLRKKRVMEFADEIEKRNLTDILWYCFSRVDILARNEDMVKRIAEVGAFQIFLGLESISGDTLNNYGKRIEYEQQMKAIELIRKYGMRVHGSFIIGNIDETEDQIMETINWAKKINPGVTQFSILTPYPGTALFKQVEKGNRFLHKKWELYDALHPTIKLDHLSPGDISRLLVKSYQSVYLQSKRFLRKTKIRPIRIKRSKFYKVSALFKPISFFMTFKSEMARTTIPYRDSG